MANEEQAAQTARSLPAIKAIVPVDTAAERLAAKDLYISKLQAQKAELEDASGRGSGGANGKGAARAAAAAPMDVDPAE